MLYDEDDGRDALAVVNELVSDRDGFLILTDITGVRNTTASVRRLPSHPKTEREYSSRWSGRRRAVRGNTSFIMPLVCLVSGVPY